MAWPGKDRDPLSSRARALNAEISRLEAEIKRLDTQLQKTPPTPPPAPPRSPAPAPASAPATAPTAPAPLPRPRPRHLLPPRPQPHPPRPAPTPESHPLLDDRDKARLRPAPPPPSEAEHRGQLGVAPSGIRSLWGRVGIHLRGPSTNNPKLVSYLAAGGIQGLRPLRYERRVARNRFLALATFILLLLLGIIYEFAPHKR